MTKPHRHSWLDEYRKDCITCGSSRYQAVLERGARLMGLNQNDVILEVTRARDKAVAALRDLPFVRMTGGDMNDHGRAGKLGESCDWDEWMDLVDLETVVRIFEGPVR